MIDTTRAKQWLKVETDADDTLIDGLVTSAVVHIEAATGKFLSPKAFTQAVAGFPCRHPYAIQLFKGPVTDIDTVVYDPADGSAEVTLANYRLVEGINATLLPAYGETWPATLDGPGTVRISGTAGYADGEAPVLEQIALQLVAHWYQNRGDGDVPQFIARMLDPFRPVGIA